MANEVKTPIPARLYNVAVGGHVAGADDIIDDKTGMVVSELVGNKSATSEDNPFNGMGVVILPMNIQEVEEDDTTVQKNILTQAMMNQANTKYVIKYDYTLGEDITIPANCVLKFEGGSISGAYAITGANTGINAGLVKIFSTDVTIAGLWNVAETYLEWFGAKGDGVTDDKVAFQCLLSYIDHLGGTIKLRENTYYISGKLLVTEDVVILGGNATLKCDHDISEDYDPLFYLSASVTMSNLKAVNTTDDTVGSGCPFFECYSNKVVINNCEITGFCTAFGQIGNYSVLTNNKIILSTVKVEAQNAFYGIHGQYSNVYICNNTISNGRHHIYVSGPCHNVTVDSNICDNSYWQNIHLSGKGSTDIVVINNKVSERGVHAAIIVSGTHENIIVSKNIVKKGIIIQGSSSADKQDILIDDNIVHGSIVLDKINGVSVINNIIINTDNHISAINTTKYCCIYNNKFVCNDSTKVILYFSNSTNIKFNDNIMEGMNGGWMQRNDVDNVLVGFVKVVYTDKIIGKNNHYGEWIVNQDTYYINGTEYYSPHKEIRVHDEGYSFQSIQWYEGDTIYFTQSSNYLLKRVTVADVTTSPVGKFVSLS